MLDNYQYNLGQLFHEVSLEHANRPAIALIDGSLMTYHDLNIISNKIAHVLARRGIQRHDVVAILNDKSPIAYGMMLACLKLGAIYSNLDPKSPIERFEKMIATCQPKIICYFDDQRSVINEYDSAGCEKLCYTSEDFNETLESAASQMLEINKYVSSNSPAYIMFTSGSTGFPKGVVISHQNIANFICWSKETYNTSPEDRFTNINPMHFDNSVFDFYASLFSGASLIPVGENLTKIPMKLIKALNELRPTIWFSVPSMLVFVVNMRALKHEDLQDLRIITFGGEGFPKNSLRKLWNFFDERTQFVNVYGPTECTCICSSYVVQESDLENDDLLPLGPIAPNFYAQVIDENGAIIHGEETGELLIGGPNVGIGYYNDLSKTQDAFIQDPAENAHVKTVYKSGDLVRLDSTNDMLYFMGRKDNQIKRMGYRIELEEIENVLNTIDFIDESAVVYVDNEKYKAKIIANICSPNKDEKKLKEILIKYLPSYMIPDLYVYCDSLPKNQNGKIDRIKIKDQLNQ